MGAPEKPHMHRARLDRLAAGRGTPWQRTPFFVLMCQAQWPKDPGGARETSCAPRPSRAPGGQKGHALAT
eukprot:CAMPEP_0117573740 /NCGR_PEP_ID=MMETSP0784-20121206/61142_1 /TAXON_ID=39447 /ORGANISM="" /LENGTH=69 /DNA_ID=CAMNT_0005372379 /DNA_START=25 /DNA_END=234 /DNA_ORIENTATION=-